VGLARPRQRRSRRYQVQVAGDRLIEHAVEPLGVKELPPLTGDLPSHDEALFYLLGVADIPLRCCLLGISHGVRRLESGKIRPYRASRQQTGHAGHGDETRRRERGKTRPN
jgi:hypothetical protein